MRDILYEECLKYIKVIAGENAEFQKDQFEAIESCINEGSKTLLVQKTGWGKSAVYFVAAKYLLEKRNKMTVIVSPLLSLTRNQILSAKNLLNIETINSAEDLERIRNTEKKIIENKVDILIVTPERFSNQKFKEEHYPLIKQNLGLLVVDEAHCVSSWGHDFRPSYMMMVKKVIPDLNTDTSVLFTTATASSKVIEDISEKNNFSKTIKGDLLRKSLSVHSFGRQSFKFSIAWFKKNIHILKGSGIIYVLTIARANAVAQYLRNEVGITAQAYHSNLEPYEKIEVENKLLNNEIKVVIATTALGMGFDKPDLGFLIHLGIPKTLTDYYQQIGRAGRKLDNADCVLISLPDDDDVNDYFIMSKVPEQPISNSVLSIIPDAPNEIKLSDIDMSNINTSLYKIKKAATRLELDGYIQENNNGSYSKIRDGSTYDTESVEPLLKQARNQYDEVKLFLKSDECLMGILLKHFDQKVENDFKCEKCSSCIDIPMFIMPSKSDIEIIPEIYELEENYVPEAPRDLATIENNNQGPTSNEDNLKIIENPEYKLLPDGYIDHPLAGKLREYSKVESEKRNIPPYGVFPKKVVNEIVIRRPKNISELRIVPGIGNKKIDDFGVDILGMVGEYE